MLAISGGSGTDTIQLNPSFITFDSLPINYANMAWINVNGGAGSDSLELDGTASTSNSISIGSGQVIFDGQLIIYSNLEAISLFTGSADDVLTQLSTPSAAFSFNLGSGDDTFNVTGGSFVFHADANTSASSLTVGVGAGASVTFNTSQHLVALNLNGGTATLLSGGSRVIVVGNITASGNGKLDLTDNALIATGMAVADFSALLGSGFDLGAWDGAGIDSSVAAVTDGHAIGYAVASDLGVTNFMGQNVASTAMLAALYGIWGQQSGWRCGDRQ